MSEISRHLKLAITLNHEALNEDVKRVLALEKNENNTAVDRPA